ncbi:MAG: squalene synthase HpnC [Blastocatellia bacterium]
MGNFRSPAGQGTGAQSAGSVAAYPLAPVAGDEAPLTTSGAYAWCERLARAHYENFPVGSLLVPARLRPHVYSIYAFARTGDDFADEGYDTPDARLAALDDWGRQLESCVTGQATHPVFIALGESIRQLHLPIGLFRDLLSAFRQDVLKNRYTDFDEVLDYCRRSANPVGRLILLLFGYRDEHLHQLSDDICTALQLANFWQDVVVDWQKDRVYLPQEEMRRFGYTGQMLADKQFNEQYVALLRFQVQRTRELFLRGQPLPELVQGRLRYELRLTWHGGMRILERIKQQGYNTIAARPLITKTDKLRLLMRSLTRGPVRKG